MSMMMHKDMDLLVVGDPFFIARYRPLVEALRKHFANVAELPVSETAYSHKLVYFGRAFAFGKLWPLKKSVLRSCIERFRKEPRTFSRLSHLAEQKINQVHPVPNIVLQLFSMSSPVYGNSSHRFVHYIDMTMAQVKRQWPAWAPFDSDQKYQTWITFEGASYRAAKRVFTFSEVTRQSVINDYHVHPDNVIVVGAAGHYAGVAISNRNYGNQTIIFNGSDFERKGGDLVLAAFRLIRKKFPNTALTILGNTHINAEPGVFLRGNMHRSDMFNYLDKTDVVLAPTRMDVIPGFVCEAMSRGVVPVLSNIPSMNEMVNHGKEGYVVAPTPEGLAAHVIALFENENLMREFGAAAQARVVKDWNWEKVAERMVNSLSYYR